MLLEALLSSGDQPDFAELARAMIKAEPRAAYKTIYRRQFQRRRILDAYLVRRRVDEVDSADELPPTNEGDVKPSASERMNAPRERVLVRLSARGP